MATQLELDWCKRCNKAPEHALMLMFEKTDRRTGTKTGLKQVKTCYLCRLTDNISRKLASESGVDIAEKLEAKEARLHEVDEWVKGLRNVQQPISDVAVASIKAVVTEHKAFRPATTSNTAFEQEAHEHSSAEAATTALAGFRPSKAASRSSLYRRERLPLFTPDLRVPQDQASQERRRARSVSSTDQPVRKKTKTTKSHNVESCTTGVAINTSEPQCPEPSRENEGSDAGTTSISHANKINADVQVPAEGTEQQKTNPAATRLRANKFQPTTQSTGPQPDTSQKQSLNSAPGPGLYAQITQALAHAEANLPPEKYEEIRERVNNVEGDQLMKVPRVVKKGVAVEKRWRRILGDDGDGQGK